MNNHMLEISREYARCYDEYRSYYDVMCAMIDYKKIYTTIKSMGIGKLFIYGASYLGVMLYRALQSSQDVIALVDKKGVSVIDLPEINVIDINKFRSMYIDESVIVTVLRYGNAVLSDLSSFIPMHNIYMLGEIAGATI